MNNMIKIFFTGDFCSKSSTSKITVSDELKEVIQSCDLKVVNFEVPLKPDITLPPQQYERLYQNDDVPASRIRKIADWAEHIQAIGADAIYLSPIFLSDSHSPDEFRQRK